jgi:hypothetical protein
MSWTTPCNYSTYLNYKGAYFRSINANTEEATELNPGKLKNKKIKSQNFRTRIYYFTLRCISVAAPPTTAATLSLLIDFSDSHPCLWRCSTYNSYHSFLLIDFSHSHPCLWHCSTYNCCHSFSTDRFSSLTQYAVSVIVSAITTTY